MMQYIVKYSVVMLVLLLSTGCTLGITGGWKPQPAHWKGVPDGPPMYQRAWADGCESGFSAYGNGYWKTFYSFKQDIKLMKNQVYSNVWWDSFNYCRHYINRYLLDGFWGNEGPGGGEAANFNQDLRASKVIQQEGFSFPWWDGAQLPGWGDEPTEQVTDYRWLGGKRYDWLGREIEE